MQLTNRLLTTCLGIGYVPKGGGTLAAAATCVVWWLAWKGGKTIFWEEALVTAGVVAIGIYSAGKMELEWGKDNYRIVIDEVAGMCISLCFVPVRWPYLLGGLVLFRLFDIIKPLYIRRMEQLKGRWGVMMDDVVAGVYANLLLQIIVWFKPW
jgi:phosphatidylglycerophosphatase A